MTAQIPEATVEFINRVTSRWRFKCIIPAHFNAPAPAGPEELQEAYAFAYETTGIPPAKPAPSSSPILDFFTSLLPKKFVAVRYPDSDMATLNAVNRFIVSSGFAER